MASKTEQDVLAKGVSLDVPPMLDPDMFLFWKKRFEVFVKSKSLRLWRIIESGDYVPRKLLPDDGNEIVKVESELAKEDETIFDERNLAIHLLYSSIPNHVFGIIYKCETANDIWKTLIMTYEGDSQIKLSKTDLATHNFENFQMLSDDNLEDTFTRFKLIISNLKALGITYTSEKYVEKFLRALSADWSDTVKTLRENKIVVLSLEDLFRLLGIIKAHQNRQKISLGAMPMPKRRRDPYAQYICVDQHQ